MSQPTTARHRRAAYLLALCASVSACASVPHTAPAAVSRAPAIAAQAQSIDGTADGWVSDGWWARYGDPQLDRLIGEALAQSPDLDAAAARVRAADGLARQASAALQPSATALGTVGASRISRNVGLPPAAIPGGWNDVGATGLGLTFDLDLWGKNRARLKAARLEAESARDEAAEARLVLTTGMAAAYAELAALHAQHDSLGAALEIRTQTVALVRDRVAQGLDNEAALDQAQARLDQTAAAISATDEAIALARNALAALAGAGPDRAATITRPDVATLVPLEVPAKASTNLLGRRPDIAAARARVAAAAQTVKVARAAFYPDVSLGALVGFQSFGLSHMFAGDSFAGGAGPAISLPLFRGGALQGQLRTTQARYDEAVALYDHQVIEAMHQAADALTSRARLGEQLDQSRRALAGFEAADRMARLRYGQGLATYLDVLTAEEGVVAQRLAVARLQTRAFALDVALVRALGGGFQS